MIAERGSIEKVVMHAHVHELVTLTQAKEFCNQDALNSYCGACIPKLSCLCRKGSDLYLIIFRVSVEIANKTLQALQKTLMLQCGRNTGFLRLVKAWPILLMLLISWQKSARIFFLMPFGKYCTSSEETEEQLAELIKTCCKFLVLILKNTEYVLL